jgi:hypothetical protein
MTVVVGSSKVHKLFEHLQLMFNLKKGGTMSSPTKILSAQHKLMNCTEV